MKPFPFQKTVSTIVLVAYVNVLVPVVPIYAQVTAPTPPAAPARTVLPAPVRTPKNVKVNRTLPSTVVNEPPAPIQFSPRPTVSEIFRARVYSEPFVPVGATLPAEAENGALAEAILAYVEDQGRSSEPFEQFLEQYPQSPWLASVHLNLGLRDFRTGWFTRAMDHYEAAWQAARSATDMQGRAVADRAFGEYVLMHARVGRKDSLEKLFAEVGDRKFMGKAGEMVAGARDGLALMQTHPELAYRCGPGALDRILAKKKGTKGFDDFLFNLPSTDHGTSLASVAGWAEKAGLDLQLAFREPGATLPTPALVHWKLGHYSALFATGPGGFIVEDPTFGARMTASMASIDAEATGYFLIPAGPLPAGWRSVSLEEAATVWGKGATPDTDKDATRKTDPMICPKPGSGNGMAVASAHLGVVSLSIWDIPVGYTPPVGPEVSFEITYNQREASQATTPDYSNLGYRWVHNWLSFVDEEYIPIPDPLPTIIADLYLPTVRLPGGGSLSFDWLDQYSAVSYPAVFPRSKDSRSILKKTDVATYVLEQPDGSKLIFAHKTGASFPYRYHLTSQVDPQGNALTFSYDGQNRLVSVTDAIGQVTTLDYDYSPDPLRVTKVTDPFGRYATFDYDVSGRLISSTDVIGIVSSFAYDGSTEIVNSMTTPYGTSNFAYGESGTGGRNRWLEITNAIGEKERVECRNDWSGLPGAGTEPDNMTVDSRYQNYRNTLHWDRKAYKDAYNSAAPDHPAVLAAAHIYHWLHTDDTYNTASSVLENEKYALEGERIWYNYPNQPAAVVKGSSIKPTKVGRVLDDTTTQLYQYAYNDFEWVTEMIDPLGRTTRYIYDSNNIDLLEVRQKTGAGSNDYEILSKATYNADHQPLTATDAAGQVTTFTYNSVGQLSSVTNAKSEVTEFFYDPAGDPAGSRLMGGARDPAAVGYLVAIDGPLSSTSDEITFQYDSYGRVAIATDTEGYAIATDYDALNRPTLLTYPDSTTRQIVYDKLDAVAIKDRRERVTTTQYNAIRQPVLTTDPLGRTTQFGWCKCGALRVLIDGNGNVTNWTHDVRSRVTGKQFADGASIKYNYEANTSRLKSVVDAKGQATNYTYYNDDRLNQVSYTNATISTPSVTFTYETNYPRLATMVDGVGTTTYAYNDIPDGPSGSPGLGDGQLASIDGPFANDTIAYDYDELGRVVNRTINTTANETDIVYDAAGRVSQVTNPLGTFDYMYVNATSRLESIDYPSGQVTNFEYWPNTPASGGNGDQRLKKIENLKPDTSNLSTFTYTYDAEGIIQAWTRKYDSGSVLTSGFAYDLADQLIGAVIPSTSSSTDYVYRYDNAGSRTSEQIDNAVNAGAHNSLNQLKMLSSTGPIRFAGSLNEVGAVSVNGQAMAVASDNTFAGDVALPPGSNSVAVVARDPLNNTTTNNYTVAVASGSGRTLTYDLVGNMTDNGAGQTYEWDAGNRLTKITYTGGARTEFSYDGLSRRVKIVEKNSGGSTTSEKRFVWDVMDISEERDGSNTVAKRFFAQGLMVGSNEFYYARDHLGSNRELTDGSGALEARYEFDPYGFATQVDGLGMIDFLYAGLYYHSMSGRYLAPYRMYDANSGRWASRDPVEEQGGTNLYGYAANNPINLIDPSGLVGVLVGAGGSADAGVYAAGAGATGSLGLGGFLNTGTGQLSGGGFASGGAFANWGNRGAVAPAAPDNRNWAVGGFAGGGLMVGVTNANCIQDLRGPFKTYSFNAGWFAKAIGIQFSIGKNDAGNTIWTLTYGGPLGIPSGGGFGVAGSKYNTNTVTTGK